MTEPKRFPGSPSSPEDRQNVVGEQPEVAYRPVVERTERRFEIGLFARRRFKRRGGQVRTETKNVAVSAGAKPDAGPAAMMAGPPPPPPPPDDSLDENLNQQNALPNNDGGPIHGSSVEIGAFASMDTTTSNYDVP